MERGSDSPEQNDPPVTVVVTRRIKPGCDDAFEALLKEVLAKVRAYEGYIGHDVIRTERDGIAQYQLVLKFDHESNQQNWEASDERHAWLERISGLLVDPPTYRVLCGLETWFTLKTDEPITPPPRHRMVLITCLAAFPVATGLQYALIPVLEEAPIVVRALIFTLILIPAMTYVVMPRMTRLFRRFLFVKEAEN